MNISDVIAQLDSWAPKAYAEDFDNVGLLVGDSSNTVSNVLVTHDALEGVIEEAIAKNCNLVVCFHPILFNGLKKITGTTYVERAIIKAIKHDISIYALHTSLDAVSHGVNKGMCDALGLQDSQILIPKKGFLYQLRTYVPIEQAEEVKQALFKAGAGAIGQYSNCSFSIEGEGTYKPLDGSNPTLGTVGELHREKETNIQVIFEKQRQRQLLEALREAHPYEEVAYEMSRLENEHTQIGMGMIGELAEAMDEKAFLGHIKEVFQTGSVRHSTLLSKKIKKVAVLGGSGAFAIQNALESGAQAFVTADLKYHDYFKAENKILLADVGHYESERYTKSLIADYLTKKNRNFAVILSEENTNPINYS